MTISAVQFEALRQSQRKEGFIFGMEPGLGKTFTALTEYSELRQAKMVTKLAVVCPNSVIGTWWDENIKHGFNFTDSEMMVINYESLIYSGGDRLKKFLRGARFMIVYDESHRLKNFNSKTTKWVTAEILPKATITRLLTGTPMAESPMDLYPQLRLCSATMGINPYAWRNKWCKTGGYMGKKVLPGCKDPERLAKFCEPYMFRATKAEWADFLPDKTFSVRHVTMTPEQNKLYYEMRRDYCLEFDGKVVTAAMAMSVMTKISQISAGFIIDDAGGVTNIATPNPKIQALLEWAEEFGHTGGKFVVVAVNKAAVKLCADALTQAGHKIFTLYGDSELSVDDAKNQFNNDDNIDGIVISVKKGGVGLTLLGNQNRPCSSMCFFQTSWSLIDRLQVIDRIHRIGQKWPCSYVDIVSSPLDAEIVRRLNLKEDAVSAVLSFLGYDHENHRCAMLDIPERMRVAI